MASSLTSAIPVEMHLSKTYLVVGLCDANLPVPISNFAGAREIRYAQANTKAIAGGGAVAQMQVTAVVSADRQSVTFYGFTSAGVATAVPIAFDAMVICSTEPNNTP